MLHCGNILEPQLVVLVSLDDHISDLLRRPELVAHGHPYPVVAVVVVSSIVDVVLAVQGREDFSRCYPEGGHPVGPYAYVDAFLPFSVDVDPGHAREVANLALQETGIVGKLILSESVPGEGEHHSVNQSEIVLHHYRHAGRKAFPGVADLPSEEIPALFHIIVISGALQCYFNESQVVV